MPQRSVLLVAFHGVFLIVLGMLVGLPFAESITGDAGPEVQRAWRVAHTSLVTAGTLYVVIAAIGHLPVLSGTAASFVTRSLVASTYALAFAFVVGPAVGARGLEPTGPPANLLVFVIFVVGLLALFCSLILVLRGLLVALRHDAPGASGKSAVLR